MLYALIAVWVMLWWTLMVRLMYGAVVPVLLNLWDVAKGAHDAGASGWWRVVLFWLVAPMFGPRMVVRSDMYAIRWAIGATGPVTFYAAAVDRQERELGTAAGLAGCGNPDCETCKAGRERYAMRQKQATAPLN